MNTERREHIRPLTGLRFLAALLVFVHHLPGIFDLIEYGYPVGAAGVAFFFVLSGFILTYVYAGKIDSWKSIGKFWFARWARIWPLHVVTLLACVLLLVGVDKSFGTSAEIKKLVLNLFLVQTWVPNLKWALGFNAVSWSIATEFFFYAMFPFLIMLSPRKLCVALVVLFTACIGTIALATFWISGISVPETQTLWESRWTMIVWVNPVMRLCEFLAGMLIGHRFLIRREAPAEKRSFTLDSFSEVATVLAMAGGCYLWICLYQWSLEKPGLALWCKWIQVSSVAVFCVPVIYVFASRKGICSWLLSRKLPVYLGEISFAFYMVHQLVIRYCRDFVVGFETCGFWFGAVTTFVLSVAVAAIMFEAFEMPARNLLLKFSRRQWKAGFVQLAGSWTGFLGSRVVIASTCAIIATVLLVNTETKYQGEQHFSHAEILPVIKNSIVEPGAIEFGQDAVLCGATIDPNPDRSLTVKLVWEKRQLTSRTRFIHVVDENEKIVFNLGPGQYKAIFEKAPLYRKFVERIQLHPEQLEDGVKLGIGLYSRDAGVVEVRGGNGLLSMGNARLDLAHFQQHPSGILALKTIGDGAESVEETQGNSMIR